MIKQRELPPYALKSQRATPRRHFCPSFDPSLWKKTQSKSGVREEFHARASHAFFHETDKWRQSKQALPVCLENAGRWSDFLLRLSQKHPELFMRPTNRGTACERAAMHACIREPIKKAHWPMTHLTSFWSNSLRERRAASALPAAFGPGTFDRAHIPSPSSP
jgi:hypothetical protein